MIKNLNTIIKEPGKDMISNELIKSIFRIK